MLRKPAASFSQYQSEQTSSCEKNEADSGFRRMMESEYSLSNSRSQREKLGDEQISTSRPTPKSTVASKKDTATHASFEDDKKVLVFGTSESDDEPDKDKENIPVSSAKKRDFHHYLSENSTKRKNAEQSEKRK